MKNKETPLLLVLSNWNNKNQTDEEQERTHFADRSASNLKHITAIQELVEVQNKRMFNSY